MLIIGAKGFAKELLEALYVETPHRSLTFYDDVSPERASHLYGQYPILHSVEAAQKHFQQEGSAFLIGVGKPSLRKLLSEKFESVGGVPAFFQSSNAFVGHFSNSIGSGSIVMPFAIIESNNQIGKGCLIHVRAFISHDCVVGDFCEISPGAQLLGNTSVGNGCALGTNCVLLPGISIGNNVTIGAGAVVTQNLPDGVTAVGVPAKIIKSR